MSGNFAKMFRSSAKRALTLFTMGEVALWPAAKRLHVSASKRELPGFGAHTCPPARPLSANELCSLIASCYQFEELGEGTAAVAATTVLVCHRACPAAFCQVGPFLNPNIASANTSTLHQYFLVVKTKAVESERPLTLIYLRQCWLVQ